MFKVVDMRKTLSKHGNSYAFVIERPILELLKVSPETEFEVITDGDGLHFRPVRGGGRDAEFRAKLLSTGTQNAELFRRLAK